MRSISEEMGIAFLGVGFDPKWRYEDVPRMPKARWVLLPNKLLGTLLAPLLRKNLAGWVSERTTHAHG